jgi:hypothetical protein
MPCCFELHCRPPGICLLVVMHILDQTRKAGLNADLTCPRSK